MLLLPCLAAARSAEPAPSPDFEWYGFWPFYYRDTERSSWLGPFVERWDDGEERGFALRPFYSRFEKSERDRSGHDVVFPLSGKLCLCRALSTDSRVHSLESNC